MCVVTGASAGIGAATVRGVAARGYDVALVARDRQRLEAVAAQCRDAGVGAATYQADFARLEDVRALATALLADCPRLDVLVNNAGMVVQQRSTTEDGSELLLAVNHLAPYLLTRLLLPRLAASAPARVVIVASDAHRFADLDLDDLDSERDWKPLRAYGRSKLANLLFAAELSRRVAGRGVAVNTLHPGFVSTSLARDNRVADLALRAVRPFIRSPDKGARTSILLATEPIGAVNANGYFVNGRVKRLRGQAIDAEAARRLWDESARRVGLPAELDPEGSV